MRDGRNGGGRRKAPVREIPFAEIARDFQLACFGDSPAVGTSDDTRAGFTYYIRVIVGDARRRDGTLRTLYDFFYLDADGTVRVAPRGYARDYKPGRITGLDEAVAKYAGGVQ